MEVEASAKSGKKRLASQSSGRLAPLIGGHQATSCEMMKVWVFNGDKARFPSGVFSSIEKAESWIAVEKLSGTLTMYRVDVSAYQWSVENGEFKPKNDRQKQPSFIQNFTGGSEHYHYELGERVA